MFLPPTAPLQSHSHQKDVDLCLQALHFSHSFIQYNINLTFIKICTLILFCSYYVSFTHLYVWLLLQVCQSVSGLSNHQI